MDVLGYDLKFVLCFSGHNIGSFCFMHIPSPSQFITFSAALNALSLISWNPNHAVLALPLHWAKSRLASSESGLHLLYPVGEITDGNRRGQIESSTSHLQHVG
jgi:hypothetical protein